MKNPEGILDYLIERFERGNSDLSFIVEMAESVQDNSDEMDVSKARVLISAFKNLLTDYSYSRVIADCFPEFCPQNINDNLEKQIMIYEEILVRYMARS